MTKREYASTFSPSFISTAGCGAIFFLADSFALDGRVTKTVITVLFEKIEQSLYNKYFIKQLEVINLEVTIYLVYVCQKLNFYDQNLRLCFQTQTDFEIWTSDHEPQYWVHPKYISWLRTFYWLQKV